MPALMCGEENMETVWYLYILRCRDDTLYTGITTDVEKRLEAHRSGRGAKYTRGRGPLKLRYRETVPDKSTALKRECILKRLRKHEKIAIIHEKENEIQNYLAICAGEEYTKCE